MIKFYFHPSPNPLKIALYLEETGEPYELIPVDTRKGEQHSEAFKAINPNAKTPAMIDGDIRVLIATLCFFIWLKRLASSSQQIRLKIKVRCTRG